MAQYVQVARSLHQYTEDRHWRDDALIGPDPGIRFNYRLWRFIKSAIGEGIWRDDLYYVQGQGYWILANLELFRRTESQVYREIAVRCARTLISQQAEDGSWAYPNPEWSGRIATAEGTWGAIGLLEVFRETGDPDFLGAALRWHEFLIGTIGFQRRGDELAINYFANRGSARIPNNTAFVLRFLAELSSLTTDRAYMEPCSGMLLFLRRAQQPNGEFPYVAGMSEDKDGGGRLHFQCFQYNAFQCMDLMRYFEITGDESLQPMIGNVIDFLRQGQGDDGHAYYECGNRYRTVFYHTAAMGAAFKVANELGFAEVDALAERAFRFLLGHQRADGGFPYSRRDYRILSDRRSYPRYLAMILYHVLVAARTSER